MTKTYSELIRLSTFEERFNYLKIAGRVGEDTFGYDRFLNQDFYRSAEWKSFRDRIIIRDNGCDMGLNDYPITDLTYRLDANSKIIYKVKIIVHHINPLRKEDILGHTSLLFDPENVICVSDKTHKAIHYGSLESAKPASFSERTPFDTCPWKKGVTNG